MTGDATNSGADYAVGADVNPPLDRIDREAAAEAASPPAHARMWRIVGFGFAVVVGLTLLLISVRLDTVRASYHLAAEERTAERLLEERRHLVVERASLRSPARLAVEAATRSTLLRPEADQWLRWPDLGRGDRWPW